MRSRADSSDGLAADHGRSARWQGSAGDAKRMSPARRGTV